MARDRITLKGGMVRGFSIPNITFPQYDAQANLANELNRRLDTIKDFALEKGKAETLIRAADYVAGNAPSLAEFRTAGTEARQELIDSGYFEGKITDKTNTLFDRAVRENQLNIIKNKMESIAKQDLDNLLLLEKVDLDSGGTGNLANASARIESTVNGLSDALVGMDGAAALELRASLAEKGDLYYKAIAELHVDKRKQMQKKDDYQALEDFTALAMQKASVDGPLMDNISGAKNEDGEVFKESTLEYLNKEVDKKLIVMQSSLVEASTLATWGATQKLENARMIKNFGLNKYSTIVEDMSKSQVESLRAKILAGKYVGAGEVDDPEIQAIIKDLEKFSPEVLSEFKKEALDIITGKRDSLDNIEALATEADESSYDIAKLKYLTAKTRTEKETYYRELTTGVDDAGQSLGFTPGKHSDDLATITNNHTARVDSVEYNPATYRELTRGVAVGLTDQTDLDDAYDKYDITLAQYDSLTIKLETELDTQYKDAKAVLRERFKVPDFLQSPNDVSELYLQAEEDLFDYYLEKKLDKTLTESGLTTKVKELVNIYKAGNAAEEHLYNTAGNVRNTLNNPNTLASWSGIAKQTGFDSSNMAEKIYNDPAYAGELNDFLDYMLDLADRGGNDDLFANKEFAVQDFTNAKNLLKTMYPLGFTAIQQGKKETVPDVVFEETVQ
jgi:hypothetical protein